MEEKKRQKKWIRTIQFLAAYLVAAWTFLQFVDWILNRYNISPHWVDVLLWLFIGIIPSLLIYLYHQERINKRILKLQEKIIFPLNMVLLILVVYFGFGNSDLGATTKDISFENSLGEIETKTITKEEFRVGVPIYNFEQLNTDSTTQWLSEGISKLLYDDLLQNKNISPDVEYSTRTTDKIRESSMFYDFYVDGSYKKEGTDFEITTSIRKASNGKELKKETFRGPDVLTLLDDISVFITSESGFIESNSLQYIDLPINEFISNSLPALEAYVNNDYKKAYDIDNGFALAYLEEAKRNTVFNRGKLETQDIIDKAAALKGKLPLQKQLEIFIQRNLAYENYKEAEEQVKLQLEVDPNNDFYNRILFAIYGETKQADKYFEKTEELFTKEPNGDNGLLLAIAAMVNGQEDQLINEITKFEIINPAIKALKLEPLLLKGDVETADNLFKELKIQNPENSNRAQPYDSIINYLKNNTPKTQDLEQFVGFYRSGRNEQTVEYWIEDDRLIQYIKNQQMRAFVPAGKDAIGGGFIQEQTFYHKLVKDENGKVIGLNANEFYRSQKVMRPYWKLDDSILDAESAFENNNLEEAQRLYKIAIQNNPNHSYLPNVLAHIEYTQNKDSVALLEQHKKFSGTYGPRKFWVKDGKFYYKRKGEDSELSKVEMLPISENRYMDMTRLNVIMLFETASNGSLLSNASQYNSDSKEWAITDVGNNIFPKDK